MQVLETRYRGYRFRSRTEARWAVYFDALKLPFDYEFEAFLLSNGERYLPDFRLRLNDAVSTRYVYAEVKGQPFTSAERLRCELLAEQTGCQCLMLDGIPDARSYESTYGIRNDQDVIIAALDGHDYPHTEARFYCGPGSYGSDGFDEAAGPLSYLAIEAARSARFGVFE